MRLAIVALMVGCVALALAACGGDAGGDDGPNPDGGATDSSVGMGRLSDVAYCPFDGSPQRCEESPNQCWNATHDCRFPALACGDRMWTCYADYPEGFASCCNDTFYVCPSRQRYCPGTGACFLWNQETDPPIDQVCPTIYDCTFTGAECVTL